MLLCPHSMLRIFKKWKESRLSPCIKENRLTLRTGEPPHRLPTTVYVPVKTYADNFSDCSCHFSALIASTISFCCTFSIHHSTPTLPVSPVTSTYNLCMLAVQWLKTWLPWNSFSWLNRCDTCRRLTLFRVSLVYEKSLANWPHSQEDDEKGTRRRGGACLCCTAPRKSSCSAQSKSQVPCAISVSAVWLNKPGDLYLQGGEWSSKRGASARYKCSVSGYNFLLIPKTPHLDLQYQGCQYTAWHFYTMRIRPQKIKPPLWTVPKRIWLYHCQLFKTRSWFLKAIIRIQKTNLHFAHLKATPKQLHASKLQFGIYCI